MDAVGTVLEQLRPQNLDPSAVTLTGEGDSVEIVILPHRDLGGVALVLWTDRNGTELLWAGIGDLSTHDDIDLGVGVARIPHEGTWIAGLADALAGELKRPIRLKQRRGLFGRRRVDCYVTIDSKMNWLAVLRPRSAPGVAGRRLPDISTSLASGPELPFSMAPKLESWRRNK
jgi:hypothetical protein